MSHRILFICLIAFGSFQPAVSQTSYDTLRTKWYYFLTTYVDGRPYDTATVANHWRRLIKTPNRTRLWTEYDFADANGDFYSAHITVSYARLTTMALAYAIPQSGLYHNDSLKNDIINALDWLYTSKYNISVPHPYPGSNATLNFWDYQIGTPLEVNNLVTLLYNELTATQKDNYLNTVDHFSHDFKERYASTDSNSSFTGANRVWISSVIALRGMLAQDSASIRYASDSLSPVFNYTTAKDGFYADGSFIQHQTFAYTGGYGKSLLEILSEELYLLKGSSWQVTDPDVNNVFKWVFNSFAPIMYKGGLMSMTLGREISWSVHEELKQGREVTQAVSILSTLAPAADTLKLKQLVKGWTLAQDTAKPFPYKYQPFINSIVSNSSIQPDSSYDRAYRQFANMDRAVQRTPKYAFVISMHSASRTMNYEGGSDENLKGWHTADGQTYLYNADTSQFNSNFWPTVDSYRLPGTTVQDSTTAPAYKLSASTWVGGASLLDRYGVTGFDFAPYSQNVDARKSWFMLDGKIVALGAAVTTGGTKRVHTYIEQRKLKGDNSNNFVVNGTTYPTTLGSNGQPDSVINAGWAHLSGSIPGTDIGYYFPDSMTLKTLRRQQTGKWRDLNLNQNTTQYSNYYLTLWKDHGVNATNTESDANRYAYVLLPGFTKTETENYAANPDIIICANNSLVQAVKDTSSNIIAANFWLAQSTSFSTDNVPNYMTSNSRAAVILKKSGDTLFVSVADPTMGNNTGIRLRIKEMVASVISSDPQVQLTSIQDSIQLLVQTSGLKGKSSTIVFLLGNAPAISNSRFVEHFNYTATEVLIGKTNPGGTNWQEHVTYPLTNGNPITVRSGDMTFPGYTASGNSILTKFAATVGAAAMIKFPLSSAIILPSAASGGTMYFSFLVNVSRSMNNTTHFLSLATNTGTLRSRIWVRRNTTPGLSFGIGHNTTSTNNAFTAAAKVYPVNTTLLLVVKYKRTGAGISDTMSLFVFNPANGSVPVTEPPTPDAVYTETSSFNKPDINGITVLQPARNTNESSDVTVLMDGLIADTAWTTGAMILPVKMLYLNAARIKESVQLKWATASEIKNDHFEILRSVNGADFSIIGLVKGAGTTNFKTDYIFTDKSAPKEIAYYKLKQKDVDGNHSYSGVVVVSGGKLTNALTVTIHGKSITAYCHATENNLAEIRLQNLAGQLLFMQKIQLIKGANMIPLPVVPSAGTYIISIKNKGAVSGTKFIYL